MTLLDDCERGLEDAIQEYGLDWGTLKKLRSMAWPQGERFTFECRSGRFSRPVYGVYSELHNIPVVKILKIL